MQYEQQVRKAEEEKGRPAQDAYPFAPLQVSKGAAAARGLARPQHAAARLTRPLVLPAQLDKRQAGARIGLNP